MYFKLRNSANPSNFEKRKGILIKLRKSTPQRLRTPGNTDIIIILIIIFLLHIFLVLYLLFNRFN